MTENPAGAWKALFETYRGAWEQALGGNDPAVGAEALAAALAQMRQATEAAEAAAIDGMRTWGTPEAQSLDAARMNARIDGIAERVERIALALEALAAERARPVTPVEPPPAAANAEPQAARPSKPKTNKKKKAK